jgi:hypothetical protein
MGVGRKRNTTPKPTRDGILLPVYDWRSSCSLVVCENPGVSMAGKMIFGPW